MFVREVARVLLVFGAREDGKVDVKAGKMLPNVLDKNIASFHVSTKYNAAVVLF